MMKVQNQIKGHCIAGYGNKSQDAIIIKLLSIINQKQNRVLDIAIKLITEMKQRLNVHNE